MTLDDVFARCTLAEMIDNDILDHSIGKVQKTDGFSIGVKGKAKFWMYNPARNNNYKLYQQDDKGKILGVRYVTPQTIVTVWRKIKPVVSNNNFQSVKNKTT